eukprot:gene583-2001_t
MEVEKLREEQEAHAKTKADGNQRCAGLEKRAALIQAEHNDLAQYLSLLNPTIRCAVLGKRAALIQAKSNTAESNNRDQQLKARVVELTAQSKQVSMFGIQIKDLQRQGATLNAFFLGRNLEF